MHVAVIVDATADPHELENTKSAARYWLRNILLDTHPHSYASVIEIGSRPRRVCALTNDPEKASDCLDDLRPSQVQSRSDLGIKEAVETLLRGRSGVQESRTINEAFYLLTDAAGERCSTIEREVQTATRLGIRVRAACASRDDERCQHLCIRDIRSHIEEPPGADFLAPASVPPIRLETLLVTHTFAVNMPLVDGSAIPAPASIATDGSWLRWRETSVRSASLGLRLRPLEIGTWPVSLDPVRGSFVDEDGGIGSIEFEIPSIQVLPALDRPTGTPTITASPTAAPTSTQRIPTATPTPTDRPPSTRSPIYLPRLVSGI